VATATQPRRGALDQISYEDLYARWEKANWRATEIDFAEDRRQWWEEFSEIQRKAALWNYSLFFYGEDSVTDNLSPYIDAAPREEQKYFLATQQADEARHAVFFARFFREVADAGAGGDIAAALRTTEPELTWGFRKVFDRLDKMADELRADRSLPQLARAVTLYHIVVEAALAQPGQHFIQSYLEAQDILPGLRSGMDKVSQDEQRHIGFGVKLLSDLIAQDPDCKEAMIDVLREVMPWTAAVLVPPGWDRRYTECFGFTLEEIALEGFYSLESKLRTVGLTPDEIQRALPLPLDIPPEERVKRSLALVQGNVLGEKPGPASTDPQLVEWMFDSIAVSVDQRHVDGTPLTIQWEFADIDPWHIRVDNGSSKAIRGRAAAPDVTLRCSWEDWTRVLAGHTDPRRLIVTRRIRPRGKLRVMMRLGKLFGR
jgi:ribonucleotide reductase beta subunit family protein with ferritin-like domain/putative sterol carrier protein